MIPADSLVIRVATLAANRGKLDAMGVKASEIGPPLDLDTELEDLAALPRPALVERWRALLGRNPPKGTSRSLLVRSLAYEMQAKQQGGLKPALRRKLTRIAEDKPDDAVSTPSAPPAMTLKPGTRLIREWNGVTHTVEVADDGFLWNGQRYASLSAVARAIAGARWSGPRFFGLKSADRT